MALASRAAKSHHWLMESASPESSLPRQMATLCAHAGARSHRSAPGPFQAPIVQSSLFNLGNSDEAEAIFSGQPGGFAYTRFGNPTVEVLAAAIARLEAGNTALITSSGNAAIHCALAIALHRNPGSIVAAADLYGGSSELLRLFRDRFNTPVEVLDSADTDRWLDAVSRAGTVLFETPSNPLMRLVDIERTAEAAHRNGATVIVDNTVATPFNQQPIAFGADLVVHSTSKYLNGHSDMIGGCLVSAHPLSPAERNIHKNLGATVNALDAWLVLRGLRSFALRMEAHNRNGAAVASWLGQHPEVEKVYYPSFADPALFRKQMKAGSGLMAFELSGGAEAAKRFLDRIRLIVHGVSLGGMESLATTPASTSHRGMDAESRRRAGLADGLVRLSVGTEAIEDIIGDLEQALTANHA